MVNMHATYNFRLVRDICLKWHHASIKVVWILGFIYGLYIIDDDYKNKISKEHMTRRHAFI